MKKKKRNGLPTGKAGNGSVSAKNLKPGFPYGLCGSGVFQLLRTLKVEPAEFRRFVRKHRRENGPKAVIFVAYDLSPPPALLNRSTVEKLKADQNPVVVSF